jgi:hypothetical protein
MVSGKEGIWQMKDEYINEGSLWRSMVQRGNSSMSALSGD